MMADSDNRDSPSQDGEDNVTTQEQEPNGLIPHQETESTDGDGDGNGMRHVESREEMFEDATDDMQEAQFQEIDNGGGAPDVTSLAKEHKKEESEDLATGVADLRRRLKGLIDKQPVDGTDAGGDEMRSHGSLHEMISECLQFVRIAVEGKLESEKTIRELRQQIDDLSAKVGLEHNVEIVADRMLAVLGMLVNPGELVDYSIVGKIDHVERSTSLLVDQYNWFLYEVDQLRQCLLEGGFNVGPEEEFGYGSIFSCARGELLELKRKEVEMVERLSRLEDENRKLVEEVEKEKEVAESANAELGKVKLELEQERNRCANTKEKLSMAVTKGKALVQKRESLKQSLAEKTSELEKCLAELQEKSSSVEAAELCKGELVKSENLIASLQETLSQRNALLESFEEILSQTNVPEEFQSVDVIGKLRWLVNRVASQQEMLLQKKAIFDNCEQTISETSVPEELKSMDIIDRLKWLVNLVASLQDTLSQKNKIVDDLEEILSVSSIPEEHQSTDATERVKWLVEERNALKDNLQELHKLTDTLSSINLPETASSSDLETRIGWLKESVKQAKDEIVMLQEEIAKTKEAAHHEIDRLSASLSVELQEKEYIKMELDDTIHRYEAIMKEVDQATSEKEQMVRKLLEHSGTSPDGLEGPYHTYSDLAILMDKCFIKIKEQSSAACVTSPANSELFERMQTLLYVRDQELVLFEMLLEEDMLMRTDIMKLSNSLRIASEDLAAMKEDKDSLQKDLERSEEKSALLREKLSLAVKKGKGLVQDRENLKQLLGEKNSEIEKLKLELQQQESTVLNCKDQINRLSTDLEQIPKLEADLAAMKDHRDQLEQFLSESNNMLQKVIESVDRVDLPVNSAFGEPVEKVNWLVSYMTECQQAKSHAESELGQVKEEMSTLASKLADAQQLMKSLEDALSVAENQIALLADEKKELEVAQRSIEEDLRRAMDEVTLHSDKFSEACEIRKSIEDALSLANNNISQLEKEREEAQQSRAAAETELEKLRDEVAVQTVKLTEAYSTIKSLEDALSGAEANLSLLDEQNSHAEAGRTNLENELKKLKDQAESHAGKMEDAFTTLKSLEDALSEATHNVSVLEDEKQIAEQKISTLNSKLNACMDELTQTNGSGERRSMELFQYLGDLQMAMENDRLLSVVKQHFEKEFDNLENMDLILKDIRDKIVGAGSEVLQSHSVMEDSHVTKPIVHDLGNVIRTEMDNVDMNSPDIDKVSFHFKKSAKQFQMRNKTLVDNFEGFGVFIDEFSGALLRKLRATKDAVIIIFEHMESMKEKIENLEMHKEEQEKSIAMLENDCTVLQSACINATKQLQLDFRNNLLELSSVPELQKLHNGEIPDVSAVRAHSTEHQERLDESQFVEIAEKLLLATRKVQTLTKVFESTSIVAAAAIEDLQVKLKETVAAFEKAKEDGEMSQKRVSELETDLEALKISSEEMRHKIMDYQVLEEKLREKEAEISALQEDMLIKEQEAEGHLMSTLQQKTLFDKLRRVDISVPESEVGNVEYHNSVEVKKLFHIVDSISEFHHQMNLVNQDKNELQLQLSTHMHEIEHLKEEIDMHIRNKQEMKREMSELIFGLEKIIDMLGVDESMGEQESANVLRLLAALEKKTVALLLEGKNSKSQAEELGAKLLGSQKAIDELSSKIKLLEDSIESGTVKPDAVQEGSIFEAPSLPTTSDISEIEDVGAAGKKTISSVPSAAHVRTMRKGSTDHLVLNIDSESSSLIKNEEIDEDKGHAFKSLNTSGLIPIQGKSIADRIDGLWVSGDRNLMSRPRARLGLIAYTLFLHIWLLATIV